MDIGKKLQMLRTERGLTQTEVAQVLNIPRQSISKWEGGGSEPTMDSCFKLADFFGVRVEYLGSSGYEAYVEIYKKGENVPLRRDRLSNKD